MYDEMVAFVSAIEAQAVGLLHDIGPLLAFLIGIPVVFGVATLLISLAHRRGER
jgi:hypothetical protein